MNGTAIIIGKFLPPTTGHRYLIDFARTYGGGGLTVHVMVFTHAWEPISGPARARWLAQAFAAHSDVHVHHIQNTLPDEPRGPDDEAFWYQWNGAILDVLAAAGQPRHVDFVFGSEPYVQRLAADLAAVPILVDVERQAVPIRATTVRTNADGWWEAILPEARPDLLWRICLVGPESTGKSTMAAALAAAYRTVCVPEFARNVPAALDGTFTPATLHAVEHGQNASEAALARLARRALVCDTDSLTTTVWGRFTFGTYVSPYAAQGALGRYHLYLLLAPTVPWIDDGTRLHGGAGQRERFFDLCRQTLVDIGANFVVIDAADHEARLTQTRQQVDALLARGVPWPVDPPA